MNLRKIIGLAFLAAIVIAGSLALLPARNEQWGKVTFRYLTNSVESAHSTQAVFELQNDANYYLPELSSWVEQDSGQGWTVLSGVFIEGKSERHWPPGKTIFRTWVPSKGGPYRLVIDCGPRQRNNFLNFVSRYGKIIPSKVSSRLLDRPKLVSDPFRVTDEKPLRKEDLPVINISL